MLPLDGSKRRVCGILICQSLAEFRIAEIELRLVTQFDFESPEAIHKKIVCLPSPDRPTTIKDDRS